MKPIVSPAGRMNTGLQTGTFQRGIMSHLANRDLDLLACLRVLLEEANVTRAAERLRMGQPAMSVALSRLRQQFSDELLVRVGRDLELTPFASSLRAPVERAVTLIETALGSSEPFEPARARKTFSLVAPDHVAALLWPAVSRILTEAPGISLEIKPVASEPLSSDRMLLREDYFAVPPVGDTMSESMVIARDVYVGLLDRDNPLRPAPGGPIDWDSFKTLPHAVAKAETEFRSPVDLMLGELGFAREPVVRVSSYLQLPTVVSGTSLLAVLPSSVAEQLAPATGTIVVELPFGPVEKISSLWWHPARRNDPSHVWFTSRLLRELS